jgi:hypothetical protein
VNEPRKGSLVRTVVFWVALAGGFWGVGTTVMHWAWGDIERPVTDSLHELHVQIVDERESRVASDARTAAVLDLVAENVRQMSRDRLDMLSIIAQPDGPRRTAEIQRVRARWEEEDIKR